MRAGRAETKPLSGHGLLLAAVIIANPFQHMSFLKCFYVRPGNHQVQLKAERSGQIEKRKQIFMNSRLYVSPQSEAAHTVVAQTIGGFPSLRFDCSLLYYTTN